MEKLVGPDWEDTAFFGIYSTLDKLEEYDPDEEMVKVTSQYGASPDGGLPTIPEKDLKEMGKSQDPATPHEEGT